MKKKKLTALLISLTLLLAMATPALALSDSDFPDIEGHWARDTLLRAHSDELVAGFEDGTLRPDEPITAAQMITVLCRVLNVPETLSAPCAVPADAWYYKDAGKAAALGLISPEAADLEAPMTRQDALSMLAKAFCLVPAEAPLAAIESYSDSQSLTADNRAAVAQLVSLGYIQGFGGALNVNSGITRGEFFTVLYRVAENYIPASDLSNKTAGGSVIKGGGSLSSLTLTDSLWFDCSADSVSLKGITAESITLLSRSHKKLELSKSRLIALALAADTESLSIPADSTVDTLRLSGKVSGTFGENVKSFELTGAGCEITVTGAHETIAASGSGNTLTLGEKSTAKRLVLSGSGNTVTLSPGSTVEEIILNGESNRISSSAADVKVSRASVYGTKNELSINGDISDGLYVSGESCTVTLVSGASLKAVSMEGLAGWASLTCTDIDSIALGGKYNTLQKYGAGNIAAVSISGQSSAFQLDKESSAAVVSVTGEGNALTLNGSAQSVTLDGRGNTVSGEGRAENVILNATGCAVTVAAGTLTDNGYAKDAERVLALVTSSYTGNFTLKWAEEHDYEDSDKEVFVNAKGYASETGYLIWVSKAMQRVNIFEGSKENWKLTYSCIVATGAMHSQTPVGVYYTTYKQEAGWTTATYTCRPVVGFYKGTGYAFHSRLYYPRSNTLTDAKIGYPVSHGCVRMYDEDVYYIYNNIPLKTTVVVF